MRKCFLMLILFAGRVLAGAPVSGPDPWDDIKRLVESGKWEAADARLRELIQEQPRLAHAHYLRGFVAGARKDYVLALESLRNAVRLSPQATEYRVALAGVYAEIGNLEASESELRQALVTNPKDDSARYWLAYNYYMRKQDVSALREARECLRQNPRDLRSLLLAADILYSANDHSAALKLYEDAQTLTPTRDGYYGLARIYSFRSERTDDAIQCLNKILERNPEDLDALSLSAAVYSQAQKYDLAERAYRQILDRNPSAEDALVSLGRLLMRT